MNKKNRTLLIVLLALIIVAGIVAAVFAVRSKTQNDETLQKIYLASSNLTIEIPKDYLKSGISTADTDLNQADAYYNTRTQIDFSVFFRAKATGETLTDAISADSSRFFAEYKETVINGVNAGYYNMRMPFETGEYHAYAYMLEDGDYLVELVFWLLDPDDFPQVEKILSTLKQNPSKYVDDPARIRLGTSSLSVLNTKNYQKGDITSFDASISQVAYFKSDETLVDFDIYQWAKADGETLVGVAEAEAEEYEDDIEVKTVNINGMELVYYYATDEYDGVEYSTVTYIVEDDGDFVELVFWLDGETAAEEADAIIQTISGSN